jgi:16S rRNA (cytidine1402-2'-O)-methyltransferase
MSTGRIYLIPTPISDSDLNDILPGKLFTILTELDTYYVEHTRTSRRFLAKAGIKNIQDIHFEILDKDTDQQKIESLVNIVKNGKSVGIMSEAGCPGIADPGSKIILLAHKYNIEIIPITGPSSIFLALMASGLNGQNFHFHGYLPIERKAREQKILSLEKQAYSNNQTQIFMETPYRNNQVLETLLKILKPDTLLCIASDLTSAKEFIKTKTVKTWRNQVPDLHKIPTIFLIYK